MVLDKLRQGLKTEHALIAQIRAHQWRSDGEKKVLLDKLQAMTDLTPDDVAWTAIDPTPEVRTTGVSILRRMPTRPALDALVPHLRTRSEAARRAVQRVIQDLAGPELLPFLQDLTINGDDYARLAVLELSRGVPPSAALQIYKRVLEDPNPALRARVLKAVTEGALQITPDVAAQLALPLLQDENEDIRLNALAVLEKNPSETLIGPVLKLARSGGGRVAEAAFRALQKLLPLAKSDHTGEVLPLVADGHPSVRNGAVSLLQRVPPDQLARGFIEQFNGAFVWVRDRAVDTICKGVPAFTVSLLRLTQDPNPNVARGALEISLVLKDPQAIPIWLQALADKDWFIRHRALESLAKVGKGREDVRVHMERLLQDPELALSAAAALGELGDPRANGALWATFRTAMDRPDDQIEILEAMARLGPQDPKVAQAFGQIVPVESIDERVRDRARDLIGKIAGEGAKSALPALHAAPSLVDFRAKGASVTMTDFLADVVAREGSDFHLATGFVPHRRVHGALEALDVEPVDRKRAMELIRQVIPDEEFAQLEKNRQLDTCVKVPGLGRFRVNVFSQRLGFDASFRVISNEVPSLEELGVPESLWDVCKYTQGLVLVTGPAGCGKSTTLAAMINRVNETRRGHIITVEDPVEVVHPNKLCLVNQRQVPQHTASFSRALKAALREDPDVIMIGEMRDHETMALAISASETGHLVFGTLHTTNAPGTIDRIINTFPPNQQAQIRTMISDSIKAVVAQALLPRRGGRGRVAAFEILRGTPAVAALIREGKTFQLGSTLQTGQLHGMNTMDQNLLKLVEDGKVDAEAAYDRASKKEPFEKLLAEERQAFA